MRTHWMAALVSLLAAAEAQEIAKVLDCTDAFTRLEAVCEPSKVPKDWAGRIEEMLVAWQRSIPEAAGQAKQQRARRTILKAATGGSTLLVAGDKEFVEIAEGAVQQVRSEFVLDHILQCTLVTLPAARAKELELEVGAQKPVDEAAAGNVLRAAVAAKGAMVNLPEARGMPLVVFQAKQAPGKQVSAKDEDRGPCIDCTALPIAANAALFDLRVDGGSARMLRLVAGTGAILRLPDDAPGMARLLWVRYTGTAPHVPTVKTGEDR